LENESLIVERLKSKDKQAFTLVFNEYFNIMVSYAYRFVDTMEEADEVVQEVFVKFWEKCDTLAEDSSIKSYLYRAVHNSCLNNIKHQKVKDGYKEYVINYLESSYSNLEKNSVEIDYLRQRISSGIEKLPPKCAEIFKLSRYEGLKYQEIADHLSISIKTVEVQMGKALRIMREELEDLKNINIE